ncbi:uncharacterized protein LOC112351508 [Selaginella moellendorffii]|uniref:uncharacterized protein LOC112351508 n=1 Tax=Selaginella moellendorffii TaxID=88036 RepID=UPI000D1C4C20|nr:uncharacterized protein LOC112351508 [Selaginella moellendorffii]|eukprot:XP_024545273.1 uncharacterized protein LOC112351508 [Selaginella moellendorffii]
MVQRFYEKTSRDHIWNADETGVRANRSGGVKVLAARGARSYYRIVPNNTEHMTVLVAINAVGGRIPGFYIFKGERRMQNWIADCEVGAAFAISKKAWMTDNLWPQWLEHFVKLVLGGCLPTNHHALIVDGHRSHVTKVALDTARMLGVDVILLPAHTSHHMQPLDIACFGPYKRYFRQCVDEHTLGHLGHEVNCQDLAQLSSRAMAMALTPTNI